jgi:hypothetical protein
MLVFFSLNCYKYRQGEALKLSVSFVKSTLLRKFYVWNVEALRAIEAGPIKLEAHFGNGKARHTPLVGITLEQ